MKRSLVAIVGAVLAYAAFATPVEVQWQQSEKAPIKAARSFHGFIVDKKDKAKDGVFVVAGGSDFVDNKKVFLKDIVVRSNEGEWKSVGELPQAVAEGVSVSTPSGIFCAGGTASDKPDGEKFKTAFLLDGEGNVEELPELPEAVWMGAAAADDNKVYVVGEKKVWLLDLEKRDAGWKELTTIGEGLKTEDGTALDVAERIQFVAAIQNGDQKEKRLVVYGGIDKATGLPLSDGYAYILSEGCWTKLTNLPQNITTIGSAFLPSGHQHLLLVGGYGYEGWCNKRRAIALEKKYQMPGQKLTEEEAAFTAEWLGTLDAQKLGWQRKIYAYNCVTDAWCEYGELAEGDKPRCGAAAGLKSGKTPDKYTLLIVGGEEAPKTRTDAVSVASFKKTGKFGAMAWGVVGVYALLMVGMACFFIFKKKDENDYFRGGNKIPWYVAGMSIFATMLSSITFIAIPTQAYLQDWRYFVMAFFIIGMAPVAIYYDLPFFCRLGITSAYEYLEKRFNLGVRLFGSAAFVVFMVCRVAVVTLLPAIALNAVTGISIDACILICGILTMIYCSLGGLEAVIWSDFVQGIVLMGGAVSVLVILILKTGGTTFWSVADSYGKTKMWDFRFLFTQPVFWVVAVQGLISNLSSYTSDQCVIQRYIATPDENATKRSLWFNGCMSVFAQVVFYGIGMALFAFYHTHPQAMDVTMPKGDSVLPIFMATEMPAWLAGLVIAAVFAATISTLSANLSSASTAVVTDFIKRFRPGISGKSQIRCGQICTYVVGIIGITAALTLARMESNALFDNFNKYIAMLTAGLTGLFFMGVFMPRIKGLAAVLGLTANYFVCFSCEILNCDVFGLKFHPFLLGGIGLVVCVVVAYIASFIFNEKGNDLTGLTLKTLKK